MKSKAKKRYKKIVFKLSEKQVKVINSFCKSKRISPNKFFKMATKEYIVHNYDFNTNDYHISENQLALFDMEDENLENDIDLNENAEDGADKDLFSPLWIKVK